MVKSEISVIITFYKEKEYQVRRSINSVLNQTIQDFELLCILDNPANEEIYRIIQDFESKDNRVKAIRLERNMGVSRARNIGVELSNSKFVSFLDGDDEFLSNSLQKQHDFMIDNPQLDLSGSLLIWKDEENDKNTYYSPFIKIDEYIKQTKPIQSIIAKRESFDKYGFYDISLKYSEDYDFIIRWYLQGAKMANLNDHLVIYYRHSHANKNATRKQVIGGIKTKLKYRRELGLTLSDFVWILFVILPYSLIIPQKIVKKIYFKISNNKVLSKIFKKY